MKTMTDAERRKVGQEQGEKFMSLWKKYEDWQKSSLLYDLHDRDEFCLWPPEERLTFLISVLQENTPQESDLAGKKSQTKREIFIKTFTSLMSSKNNYHDLLLFYSDTFSAEEKDKRLTMIEKMLKSFEHIQYFYYTSRNEISYIKDENTFDLAENFFFSNGLPKRSLHDFLSKVISDICPYGKHSEENPVRKDQILRLSFKIAIQSFNVDLLGRCYKSIYDQKIVLPLLKEEYHRCIKVILNKKGPNKLKTEEEKILETGKFSEKIRFLGFNVHNVQKWIIFMIELMALNGDFDSIKI